MSTSLYLVSSDKITREEGLKFIQDLSAVDVDEQKVSGLICDLPAVVWINYLASFVLEESDEEELAIWCSELKAYPCSFYELTLGKEGKCMELAVKIAREGMKRWNMVVDDLDEMVYTKDNLDLILEP